MKHILETTAKALGGQIRDNRELGGGDINHAFLLSLTDGRDFFVKIPRRPAPGGTATGNHPPYLEARGLEFLRAAGLPVPTVHAVGKDFLALDYIERSGKKISWFDLGAALARCHQQARTDQAGLDHDNYIGSTPQPNTRRHASWVDFFREERLLFQVRLARKNGASAAQVKPVEQLCVKLEELIPAGPHSLLHGDLWTGNIYNGYFIDPAVYYGHGEADLAMTRLFGSFPAGFYSGYDSVPMDPESSQALKGLKTNPAQRSALYNIYHLLNHFNLFGGSHWLSQAGGNARPLL